jgi:hypothetical protein
LKPCVESFSKAIESEMMKKPLCVITMWRMALQAAMPRCAKQDYRRIEAEATPMREGVRGQKPSGGPPWVSSSRITECFLTLVSIRACALGVTKTWALRQVPVLAATIAPLCQTNTRVPTRCRHAPLLVRGTSFVSGLTKVRLCAAGSQSSV